MCEKFSAQILKINFCGPKICIKSGFCNEPKIANISHCARVEKDPVIPDEEFVTVFSHVELDNSPSLKDNFGLIS